MIDYVVQQSLNALSFGAEYALIALGLAIVFSIMGLVNFAHGEVIAIGGYSMMVMAAIAFRNPIIIIVGAIFASVIMAVFLERIAFRPVRYADATTGLLTAFGVSLILQNLFLLLVSPRPIAVTSMYFLDWPIKLGSIRISSLQIFETLATLLAILFLVLFLKRSFLGIAMRAASLDFEMVRLMGIRANRVIATAFAISGLLAGIAAIFIIARRGAVDPTLGFNPVLKAFVACVLGPTNRTCSMSPDVNNPGFRNVSFDELKNDYEISINGLVDSGVDLIMIETIFDTLNAKAALMALKIIDLEDLPSQLILHFLAIGRDVVLVILAYY